MTLTFTSFAYVQGPALLSVTYIESMEEEYPVQPMAHAATEQPLLRQATPPLPILQSSTPGFATPPPVTTVEGTSSSTPPTRLVMADISNINIKAVHAQAKRRGWERRRRAAGVAVAFEAAAAAAQEAQHAQRQLHLVAQQPGEGVAQWHWHLAVAPVPRQGATMASPAPGAPATIASVPLRLAEVSPSQPRPACCFACLPASLRGKPASQAGHLPARAR